MDSIRGGHRQVRTDYRGCDEVPAVAPVDPVFGALERSARTTPVGPADGFDSGATDFSSVLGSERASAEDVAALAAATGSRKDLWDIFDANLRSSGV